MRAYNKETDSWMVFDGSQWVPAPEEERGVIAKNPETGQTSHLQGDQWVNPYLDMDREASASDRFWGNVKATPEGTLNYLKSVHGDDNVFRTGESIFIRDPETGKEYPYDKSGYTWKDLIDVGPDIAQAAPEVAAGIAGVFSPWAAALLAGGGQLLRYGASKALPGDDEASAWDVAKDTGRQALTGGLMQAGTNKLFGVVDQARPHNWLARETQNLMDTPYTDEGLRIVQETGIPLSPGRITGSRTALMMENAARNHPLVSDDIIRHDMLELNKTLTYLNKIMNKVNPDNVGDITVGTRVSDVFNNALGKLRKVRGNQWQKDMAVVDQMVGGSEIFSTNNTLDTLDGIIKSYDLPGATDTTQKLVSTLKRMRNEFVEEVTDDTGKVVGEKAVQLTPEKFRRLMSYWSKASAGENTAFENLTVQQNRALAGKISRALNDDLDDLAGTSAFNESLTKALRQARANYAGYSSQMDDIKGSVLGRMLGGKYEPSPTRISEQFLKMKPDEIKTAARIIMKEDPGVMQEVKRNMLERILESSQPGVSQQVIGSPPFSAAKWGTAFQKNYKTLDAVFTKEEMRDLRMVFSAVKRLADIGNRGVSPTTPMKVAMDLIHGLGSITGLSRIAGERAAFRRIAHIVTDPEGLKAMATIARSSGRTKGTTAAIAYLSTLMADMELPTPEGTMTEMPEEMDIRR